MTKKLAEVLDALERYQLHGVMPEAKDLARDLDITVHATQNRLHDLRGLGRTDYGMFVKVPLTPAERARYGLIAKAIIRQAERCYACGATHFVTVCPYCKATLEAVA